MLKQSLKQTIIVILLSVGGMAGTLVFHPHLPPWNPMTIEEGEIALEMALALENKTWIDARAEQAFEEAHIPGALLLNEDHWDEHFDQFIQTWDGSSTLIVYCDSRTCAASKAVAERLKEALGSKDILVLKGGWQTWLGREM